MARTEVDREILLACELHDADRLADALARRGDPNAAIEGMSPLERLLEMYTRSPRFSACVRVLLEAGATLGDEGLVPVLLDDAAGIALGARRDREFLDRRVDLPSAFTPLQGVTPLHVAAEFGLAQAARALIEAGADVEARAARDGEGLNGQTPIFHTVNAPLGFGLPLMRLLLQAGARPDVRLDGIVWGRGLPWETAFFDVTPISYAQCGLTAQMHRDEVDTATHVSELLRAAGRRVPSVRNVPNEYLRASRAAR